MSVKDETLRDSGRIINRLARAVNSTIHSFTDCPDSVKYLCQPLEKKIIKDFKLKGEVKRWMFFFTDDFGLIKYKKNEFEKFVTESLPKGLGSSIDKLKLACSKDNEALTLLDQAMQRKAGAQLENKNNRHSEPTNLYNVQYSKKEKAPTGNTKQAGLRRLRKDRKDLHELVLKDEMSVNQAMIEAGFRSKKVQLELMPEKVVELINRHFTEDQKRFIADNIL